MQKKSSSQCFVFFMPDSEYDSDNEFDLKIISSFTHFIVN